MVAPVEPPADLLEKIMARSAGDSSGRAIICLTQVSAVSCHRESGGDVGRRNVGAAARTLVRPVREPMPTSRHANRRSRGASLQLKGRRWQEIGAVLATLAAAIAVVFVTSLVRPDLMPAAITAAAADRRSDRVIKPSRCRRRSQRACAVYRGACSAMRRLPLSFSRSISNDRTMTVRRVAADNPVGKSYELWLVSNRFPAPRSLGVVQPGEFTQPAQLASYEPDTIRDAVSPFRLNRKAVRRLARRPGPCCGRGKLD